MSGSGNPAARRTPYNDRYPTCERTYAALLIYPEVIKPAEISERLGVAPTRQSVKGVDEATPSGKVRPAPKSLWMLSSEGQVDSLDVRRHLDWLIERLMPARQKLLELQLVPGTRMGVNCIWWSAHATGGPTVWPEQMSALAELGLELSFDVSFYGPDEDAADAGT
jgi:hypothetical protein